MDTHKWNFSWPRWWWLCEWCVILLIDGTTHSDLMRASRRAVGLGPLAGVADDERWSIICLRCYRLALWSCMLSFIRGMMIIILCRLSHLELWRRLSMMFATQGRAVCVICEAFVNYLIRSPLAMGVWDLKCFVDLLTMWLLHSLVRTQPPPTASSYSSKENLNYAAPQQQKEGLQN